MKAIIIGAGRGARLMPHTADAPKCFAEVKGKRILDWGLEALASAGLDDVVYIGGYRIEMVREAYPHFTFCHNADWQNNNILESLMHAADHMDDGFVCAYSDILYTPQIVQELVKSPHEMTLVCDTDWRARYVARTDHPENDGEKIKRDGSTRVAAINRTMPSETAYGEYIGVARFTPGAAAKLRSYYEDTKAKYGNGPFQASKTFRKAYLIDLFQHMIEAGEEFHALSTPGGYMEIDTNQDFQIAREDWAI